MADISELKITLKVASENFDKEKEKLQACQREAAEVEAKIKIWSTVIDECKFKITLLDSTISDLSLPGNNGMVESKDNSSHELPSTKELILEALEKINYCSKKDAIELYISKKYKTTINIRHGIKSLMREKKIIFVRYNNSLRHTFLALPDWVVGREDPYIVTEHLPMKNLVPDNITDESFSHISTQMEMEMI